MVYFSEHFQNLITLKKLSLRIDTLIPPLFPLFRTVLEPLQSDSLQCHRRFLPHLLYILKTLSFKVPLHSWKQKKSEVPPLSSPEKSSRYFWVPPLVLSSRFINNFEIHLTAVYGKEATLLLSTQQCVVCVLY